MRSVIRVIAGFLALGAAPLMAAESHSVPAAPAQVELTVDGPILVTPSGMTLYIYGADDGTPGKSQCTNVPRKGFPDPTAGFGSYPLPRADVQKSCAQQWPPYLASDSLPAQPAPSGSDWSTIDRPEGGKQWAYRGHPLYTSTRDLKPGDRNSAFVIGQLPVGGRGWNFAFAPWNIPPGMKLVRRDEGLVLATANGRPVYTPVGARARSACDGCGGLFQPLAAPAVASVKGEWTIVDAGGGRQQYAFKRKALYAPPEDVSDSEIRHAGGWQTVLLRASDGTPTQIQTHFSLLGDVFTDKAGMTLYAFTCSSPAGDGVRCDEVGDAAAYWAGLCGEAKECARRWHPYLAGADARPRGEWSVVDVAYPMFTDVTGPTSPPEVPRVKAWAYRGMPAYTYYEDKQPGEIWGNAVRWFSLSGFYALQVPGRGLLD